MEAIQTFATRVTGAFDKIAAAVDGVTADVADLKAQIAELQNSPGAITPEDQITLDAIQERAEAIATKLAALDAATEQTPEPVP